MIIALASIALVLLAAPALTVRVGRRVHPADWTRWSFGSLLVGAVAAEAALVLFALPTMLRALGAHALVAACARMTGSLMPGGPVVGWSIAATSVLLPVGFGLGVATVRRTNRSVSACVAGVVPVRIGGHDVVLVALDDAVALTVGGDRRVIVVSDGCVGHSRPRGSRPLSVMRHRTALIAMTVTWPCLPGLTEPSCC